MSIAIDTYLGKKVAKDDAGRSSAAMKAALHDAWRSLHRAIEVAPMPVNDRLIDDIQKLANKVNELEHRVK